MRFEVSTSGPEYTVQLLAWLMELSIPRWLIILFVVVVLVSPWRILHDLKCPTGKPFQNVTILSLMARLGMPCAGFIQHFIHGLLVEVGCLPRSVDSGEKIVCFTLLPTARF